MIFFLYQSSDWTGLSTIYMQSTVHSCPLFKSNSNSWLNLLFVQNWRSKFDFFCFFVFFWNLKVHIICRSYQLYILYLTTLHVLACAALIETKIFNLPWAITLYIKKDSKWWMFSSIAWNNFTKPRGESSYMTSN